ncbi:MAG: hypothetical protein K8R53_06245, partial [Bacteroidales bacterium]|nr:hypothetical protein [Bacteroidales bacterium]
MNKYIVLLVSVFLTLNVFCQNQVDVVTLKDGTVYKGTLLEMKTDEYVRIKTIHGRVVKVEYSEFDKLTKEELDFNTSEYGGFFSGGMEVGGGGILGVPLRFYLNEKTVFQAGIHFRPII